VIIHVAGAVLKPGLIVLTLGDRVVDAILRAGGLSSAADQCAVNLARVVTDGEQIIVPSTQGGQSSCSSISSTTGGSSFHSSTATKTSLSRATLDQLDALPGVGPALAQRIIDWRTAHGGFQSVDQLDDVSGIGAKLMASLKPLVTP
jgi:competence protein ComEA